MRQVFGLHIGLETAHYLVLPHYVVQPDRPVLLNQISSLMIDPSCNGWLLSLYQYCCNSYVQH